MVLNEAAVAPWVKVVKNWVQRPWMFEIAPQLAPPWGFTESTVAVRSRVGSSTGIRGENDCLERQPTSGRGRSVELAGLRIDGEWCSRRDIDLGAVISKYAGAEARRLDVRSPAFTGVAALVTR